MLTFSQSDKSATSQQNAQVTWSVNNWLSGGAGSDVDGYYIEMVTGQGTPSTRIPSFRVLLPDGQRKCVVGEHGPPFALFRKVDGDYSVTIGGKAQLESC